jgi:transcriptional regulator with XRE-family HTH domain
MWTREGGARWNPRMANNPMLIPKAGPPRHYVREWRKFRGLTQERLAERTPYSPGAISQLETGRTNYTQAMLEALADALRCKPGDLLSRNPFMDGDVVHLFNDLPDDKKRIAIEMLKTLRTA